MSTGDLPSAFARRLVANDLTVIESRCNACGFLVVGSVMEGLAEKEADHLSKCVACAGQPGQSTNPDRKPQQSYRPEAKKQTNSCG
jgi:hypothetical protein